MSQAELARLGQITTNYVSRLEGGGAAPGIDLVARLAAALRVPLVELLPMPTTAEDLPSLRERARRLADSVVANGDRAIVVLLTQVLSRLSEAANR